MTGAVLPGRPRSSPSSRRGTAQHGVDIDEIIRYRRGHDVLRNVAFGTEETARRHRSEELAIAVHKGRDANHRGLGLTGDAARVARQTLVARDVDLVDV